MKVDQELIERLRDLAKRCNDRLAAEELESLCDFHASRLQALVEEVDSLRESMDMLMSAIGVAEQENAKLREALKPFAELSGRIPENIGGATSLMPRRLMKVPGELAVLSIEHLRRAQAALSTTDDQ